MAKSGPKPRIWTDAERALVRNAAIAGIPQEHIARALKTTKTTLEENFETELKDGKTHLGAIAVGQLAQKIRAGNLTAIIFYLKTQHKWRETERHEITGKDGADFKPVLNITIRKPD